MPALDRKVIIVTGSASGIGAAIAAGLAAEGASIGVADLDLDRAQLVAATIVEGGGAAKALRVDVTDRDSVSAGIAEVVAEFGRLDGYFNNAGVNAPQGFLDVTRDKWDLILNVNAWGAAVGTQEAARQFIRQGTGGKIVNTASIAGRTGYATFMAYSASKSAVISITQAGARALAQHGITVNAFSPGVVATPLWTQLDRDLAAIGETVSFDGMSEDILLGRPATPEDIVPVATFLASSSSDYITGQVIPIDGGMILV